MGLRYSETTSGRLKGTFGQKSHDKGKDAAEEVKPVQG